MQERSVIVSRLVIALSKLAELAALGITVLPGARVGA